MKRPAPISGDGAAASRRLCIVGSPNVGKSVLFNALSGEYAAVSNYPGTSVEVTRGRLTLASGPCEVVDTPGMYSLRPLTEEERVARRLLLDERPDLVLHVIDAKNIERMLPMTLQLLEAELPLILALNMSDEAARAGLQIDTRRLSARLGVGVVAVAATLGQGIDELKAVLSAAISTTRPAARPGPVPAYPPQLEKAMAEIAAALPPAAHPRSFAPRCVAALLLSGDTDVEAIVGGSSKAVALARRARAEYPEPVEYRLAAVLADEAAAIAADVQTRVPGGRGMRELMSRLTMNPLTGLPILFAVLYFGLYRFVGGFGAGTVVGFLEGHLFDQHLTPLMTAGVERIIPWPVLRDLFTGEYGLLTLGLRYSLALILPLVTFFFLVFAVIEDSGYLPRLAMLVDRTFKHIGLSGRAVIPMVLGLGCDTMATLVTRTLPTARERLIATLLLALAVPCSAQLGVILALLAGHPRGVAVWALVIVLVFLLVGFLTAQLLPGRRASFYMEIPPLRWPQLTNVLMKTYVRVKWYMQEVIPLFLLASVLVWLARLTGLFALLVRWLETPVRMVGLPPETAPVFLFGFFRRDFGAAGLYDLSKQGALNGAQLVVASVALTLFLPCVAQFLMNIKERGLRAGLAISAFVLVFSFAAAYVLNRILLATGVAL